MKLRTVALVWALAAPALQASAQMIVHDPKALVESIKQVRAWTQQFQQMATQIDQAKAQFDAFTGNRGMARVLPTISPALPPDWTQSMTQLSSLAQQIRQAQAVLTPQQISRLSPDLQMFLAQAQNLSAANQALAQTAYNDAAVRQSRLQTLNATLATTNDPKAAYDLANRIAIEHAELVKDQSQLEAAASGAAAQDRANKLMVDQMRAASFGTQIPRIDTSLP